MKRWHDAARDALASGSAASVASTGVLALRGHVEDGTAVGPTNAISHWLWGRRALHEDEASLRFTGLGYLTHHVASILWATLFERWFGMAAPRGDWTRAAAGAAAVASLACFVDYRMTPKRLQPGYEERLSRRSLAAVYVALGAGFVIGSALRERARQRAALAPLA